MEHDLHLWRTLKYVLVNLQFFITHTHIHVRARIPTNVLVNKRKFNNAATNAESSEMCKFLSLSA